MNGEYWYKYIKEHKPDVLGKDIIDYVEQLKLDKKALEKQLNLHDVTKRNWFEKLPLHWRLLYYFIGGIIIGLLLPYVW